MSQYLEITGDGAPAALVSQITKRACASINQHWSQMFSACGTLTSMGGTVAPAADLTHFRSLINSRAPNHDKKRPSVQSPAVSLQGPDIALQVTSGVGGVHRLSIITARLHVMLACVWWMLFLCCSEKGASTDVVWNSLCLKNKYLFFLDIGFRW